MEGTKKVLAAALMAALLASIGGCIVADRPYRGNDYRYRDRYGYDCRYDRYHGCWGYDRHERDWDRR